LRAHRFSGSVVASPAGPGAGVEHLIDSRRRAIRSVASRHRVAGISWWPPSTEHPACLDFVVENAPPAGLDALRGDLERVLGCRVAVYLAVQIPAKAWGRFLVEPVAV
jgi:hypothetical protein